MSELCGVSENLEALIKMSAVRCVVYGTAGYQMGIGS